MLNGYTLTNTFQQYPGTQVSRLRIAGCEAMSTDRKKSFHVKPISRGADLAHRTVSDVLNDSTRSAGLASYSARAETRRQFPAVCTRGNYSGRPRTTTRSIGPSCQHEERRQHRPCTRASRCSQVDANICKPAGRDLETTQKRND